MARVTVRRSRLSSYSSLLMVALGIVTYLFVNPPAGIALMALGGIMYLFYRRLSGRQRPAAGAAS